MRQQQKTGKTASGRRDKRRRGKAGGGVEQPCVWCTSSVDTRAPWNRRMNLQSQHTPNQRDKQYDGSRNIRTPCPFFSSFGSCRQFRTAAGGEEGRKSDTEMLNNPNALHAFNISKCIQKGTRIHTVHENHSHQDVLHTWWPLALNRTCIILSGGGGTLFCIKKSDCIDVDEKMTTSHLIYSLK